MADLVAERVTWRGTTRAPEGGVRLCFHRPDGGILRIDLARGCALTVADTIEDHLGRPALAQARPATVRPRPTTGAGGADV